MSFSDSRGGSVVSLSRCLAVWRACVDIAASSFWWVFLPMLVLGTPITAPAGLRRWPTRWRVPGHTTSSSGPVVRRPNCLVVSLLPLSNGASRQFWRLAPSDQLPAGSGWVPVPCVPASSLLLFPPALPTVCRESGSRGSVRGNVLPGGPIPGLPKRLLRCNRRGRRRPLRPATCRSWSSCWREADRKTVLCWRVLARMSRD